MSIPTLFELDLLKTRPQQTQLYLSIYQPQTALACRLNSTGTNKEMREIPFDTVTEGSFSLVEPGFILLVGSSAGSDDKGKIRVKDISPSVITVAENSHINWSDNDYLTILRFVEINPIFTRIIQNPSNELDVIFYKDYDIAYTNQNEVFGAFVNMGPHYAGVLDDTGQCQVYYSASGTSHLVSGTSLSYSWFFEGASSTGSNAHTPGIVTYNSPGHYLTRLTVTGSNGSEDVSYRNISIYDRPGKGTKTPILDWRIESISGSRNSGGYKTRIRVRSDVPENVIRDGSLVVIFADDWYGMIKQSIGGNALGRQNIRFVGYILNGTIEYNYADGYVEFEVGSPTQVMERCESFSVSVESKASPSTWYEIKDMNGKKAIYHYLRWHSTVLQCCDFQYLGDDYNIQYFDADRTSLYDSIRSLMKGTYFGDVICDRQGKIWAEVSYKIKSNGDGFPVNMTITKSDWINNPAIDEIQIGETSFIEMGGIRYDGPEANTFQALLCSTPGSSPEYRGKVERIQGLALESQDHLNSIAGNYFAHQNVRYPQIDLNLSGNYTNFDIAPQELVKFNLEANDTPRKIVFNEKLFAVENVSIRFDEKNEIEFVDMGISEVTSGIPADTIIIPDVPPTDSKPPKHNPVGPGGIVPGTTIVIGGSGTANDGVSLYGLVSSTTIATGTSTAFSMVVWDRELYDTANFWSPGTGSVGATVTFPSSGNYLITCHAWLSGSRSPELGGDPWTASGNANVSLILRIESTDTAPLGDAIDSIGVGTIVNGYAYGSFVTLASATLTAGLAKNANNKLKIYVSRNITDKTVLPYGTALIAKVLLQVTKL
jgi:hypothetical protein